MNGHDHSKARSEQLRDTTAAWLATLTMVLAAILVGSLVLAPLVRFLRLIWGWALG